ncbi:MAG: RecQ family ATP-dependent DNA helicase [Bacteroidales bacterium]|nr:RecQ family ATP-dependent DNA helicase [Bacteroidales bacterium]
MTSPVDILGKYWGYDSFRPMQAEIIDSVLKGHDTLGLLATGGGKSLTFQVPAMMLDGVTVVVTPLVSLMKDQVDNLRERGVDAYFLHAALTRRETALILDKCRLGYARILYLSPEKLQSPRFAAEISQLPVSLIVVDEAHCISQWGYDFRPSYLKIAELRGKFPQAPVLALTASATPEVARDICERLEFRKGAQTFRLTFNRQNLSYVVRNCENKDAELVHILRRVEGCGVVYVRSRKRSALIAEMLSNSGISAEFYHAGLSPEEKNARQNRWKTDVTRIMVATTAFGMGIDKPDVRIVVHVDPPSSLEEYYQEAGRAGRDGKPSYAVALVNGSVDKATLSRRLTAAFPPKDYMRSLYGKLCVSMNIAMGEGYQRLCEINLEKFCGAWSLQPQAAVSALKLLSQSGYIEYVEEVSTRSRLMVIMTRNELYDLRLNPECERVFQFILRNYTGIFADYEHISESLIASSLDLTERTVYENLLLLGRLGVIHYVPRSSTPYVMFLQSRQPDGDIRFPQNVYEFRKIQMKKRIDAMRRFLFDDSRCRSLSLLEYFGEEDAGSCGRCDVCRSSRNRSRVDPQKLRDAVCGALASHPHGLAAGDIAAFLGANPERITGIVRSLADENRIIISSEGICSLAV